jgi:hypothetical protein
MRLTVLLMCFALVAITLPGCGIKPNKVSAPASVEKDTFPQIYPNPANDPKPTSKLEEKK